MSEEKKIIIDEDWKSQVQAEKDAAAKKLAGEAPPAPEAGQSEFSTTSAAQARALPPASFEMLVTTLATEALVALGQMPHPATDKAELELDQAKYLIDTLDVLQQKTKGNLTPPEQQLIDSVLHQMRMLFVAVANQPAAG